MEYIDYVKRINTKKRNIRFSKNSKTIVSIFENCVINQGINISIRYTKKVKPSPKFLFEIVPM